MDFIKTLPELADLEAPRSINSLEADLLRDAVAELCDANDQNERLRPAVENLVYVLNHHWLMWAHNWELTLDYKGSPADANEPHSEEMFSLQNPEQMAEDIGSMIEQLGRDYPDKPEMVAEVRAAYAKFLQECNAPQEVG